MADETRVRWVGTPGPGHPAGARTAPRTAPGLQLASADSESRGSTPAQLLSEGAAKDGEAAKVWLIEDDDALRRILGRYLHREVELLRSFSTARLALEAARREPPPDLVVLDLRLGAGLDGPDLLRALRQRWPALPALAITGDSNVPSTILDGVPVLHKPFQLGEFLGLVRALL